MAQTTIILNDKKVAAKYVTDRTKDPTVHVCRLYKGKLSNIPLDAADALFSQNSNLLNLKEVSGKNAQPLDTGGKPDGK